MHCSPRTSLLTLSGCARLHDCRSVWGSASPPGARNRPRTRGAARPLRPQSRACLRPARPCIAKKVHQPRTLEECSRVGCGTCCDHCSCACHLCTSPIPAGAWCRRDRHEHVLVILLVMSSSMLPTRACTSTCDDELCAQGARTGHSSGAAVAVSPNKWVDTVSAT